LASEEAVDGIALDDEQAVKVEQWYLVERQLTRLLELLHTLLFQAHVLVLDMRSREEQPRHFGETSMYSTKDQVSFDRLSVSKSVVPAVKVDQLNLVLDLGTLALAHGASTRLAAAAHGSADSASHRVRTLN